MNRRDSNLPSDQSILLILGATTLFLSILALLYGEYSRIILTVPTAVIVGGIYFFAKYWIRPRFWRLIGIPDQPESAEPEEVQREARTTPDFWFLRMRILLPWQFVTPVVVCGGTGLILSEPVLGVALGIVLGLAILVTWAAMWIVASENLRSRGFRW